MALALTPPPRSPSARRRRYRATMLRLGRSVLTQIIASPSTSPGYPLHRLLSVVAAPNISPNPSFAVEDYLIGTCGLTRPQALKASPQLSGLKSPSRPDAVRSFLVGLGLSTADIAALVAKDPQFLCAGMDRTLAPIATGLTGLGLSHTEIARLVSLAPGSFRCKSIVPNLPYYLSLFGSYEKLLRALKRTHANRLSSDLDRVVKPNVAFLLECGLGACDIAKLCILLPQLLSAKQERLQAMVACCNIP